MAALFSDNTTSHRYDITTRRQCQTRVLSEVQACHNHGWKKDKDHFLPFTRVWKRHGKATATHAGNQNFLKKMSSQRLQLPNHGRLTQKAEDK